MMYFEVGSSGYNLVDNFPNEDPNFRRKFRVLALFYQLKLDSFEDGSPTGWWLDGSIVPLQYPILMVYCPSFLNFQNSEFRALLMGMAFIYIR